MMCHHHPQWTQTRERHYLQIIKRHLMLKPSCCYSVRPHYVFGHRKNQVGMNMGHNEEVDSMLRAIRLFLCTDAILFFSSFSQRSSDGWVAWSLYRYILLICWWDEIVEKKKHLYTAKPVFVCVYIVHIVTVLSDCGWWYVLPKDCNTIYTINIGTGRL